MATRTLGIIMHGVTGRMGLNQHLVRSILAIRDQGGVALPNGDRVMPDPILVGRNAEKIAALAKQYGVARSTTDLGAALKNPNDTVFFDAATTQMRADLVTPGDRGRQAHLLREAGRGPARQGGRARQARETEGREERRGAGQAVPARPAQDPDAARGRFLRPHLRGARRVRLLGVRGRLGPAGAAAELELQESRRRRHHSGHAVPLALRARQPVRRRAGGELPRPRGFF